MFIVVSSFFTSLHTHPLISYSKHNHIFEHIHYYTKSSHLPLKLSLTHTLSYLLSVDDLSSDSEQILAKEGLGKSGKELTFNVASENEKVGGFVPVLGILNQSDDDIVMYK